MAGNITSLRCVGGSEVRAGLEAGCAGPPHSITGKTNSCDWNQCKGNKLNLTSFQMYAVNAVFIYMVHWFVSLLQGSRYLVLIFVFANYVYFSVLAN